MKFECLFLALTISLASAASLKDIIKDLPKMPFKDLPNVPKNFDAHLNDHHASHLMGHADPTIQPHCDMPFDTPLKACAENERSAFEQDDKIAIIGAGASGLTMAYLLNKKGFKNVELLEKENFVGGYAQTVYYNGSSVPHEQGACYTVGRYECVLRMADEFFMTSIDPDPAAYDVKYGDFAIGEFNTFWFWYLNTFLGFELTSAQEFGGTVVAALGNYRAAYLDIMGDGEYLFPAARPAPEKLDRLNMTMLEYLQENDCIALIPFLFAGQSFQGYGFLDTLPALYGVIWFSPSMVDFAYKVVFDIETTPGIRTSMFKEGYGELMNRVSQGMNIKTSVDIKNVRRSRRNVEIEYTDGQGVDHTSQYDFLIVTSRMPESLSMFDPVFAEEQALFEKLVPRELTLAHVAMDFPNNATMIYQFENAHTWTPNKISTIRDDQKWIFPDLEYGPDQPDIRSILTETDPNTSDEDLEAILTQNLADEGVLSSDFLRIGRYEYHSAYTVEETVAGLPWDVRDLQGKYRTWYTGSFASFESVADVMDYNLQLIQEDLCIDEAKADLIRKRRLWRRCERLNNSD